MKKIAVYGWYRQENFGDDVMAVMICREVRKYGFRPVAYCLSNALKQAEQLESASTIEELVKDSSAVIIGGGAWLASVKLPTYKMRRDTDEELLALASACEEVNVPIFAVSIGGDGSERWAAFLPGLIRVLKSKMMRGCTVRLKSDISLASSLGIISNFHHDIVFLASEYWPLEVNEQKNRHYLILHNVAEKPCGNLACMALVVPSLARFRERCFTITAHGASSPLGKESSFPLCVNEPYSSISRYAHLIAQSRLIVTTKLHLGIFAMSFGTPFVSYYGQEKTRAQLHELGLGESYFTRRKIHQLAAISLSRKADIPNLSHAALSEIKSDARGHIDRLKAFLGSVS